MSDAFDTIGMIGIVVIGSTVALLLASQHRDRARVVRTVLWLGLLVPLWVSTDSTDASSVGSDVGPMAVIRGGVPAVCIVVAALMRHDRWRRSQVTEFAVAAFLLACAMSALWSASASATVLKMLVLAFQFVLAGMLVRCYPTVRDALNGLATVGLLMLATVAAGFIVDRPEAVQASGASTARLQGVYPYIHPNSLGYLAGVTAVLLITGMGPRFVRRGVLLRGVFAVLALGVLLWTQTRYAIVLILVIAAIVSVRVWRTVRSRETSFVLFIFGHLALGAAILVGYLNADQIVNAFARGQSTDVLVTLTGRTDIWTRAWALWGFRPLQGWGFYSGHRILLSSLPGTDAQLSNIDNMWLETLVDTGLIGGLILAVLVASGLVRILRRSDGDRPAQIALVSVAIFGLVASFLNPSIQTNGYPGIIFGFVLLLGAHPSRSAPSRRGWREERAAAPHRRTASIQV